MTTPTLADVLAVVATLRAEVDSLRAETEAHRTETAAIRAESAAIFADLAANLRGAGKRVSAPESRSAALDFETHCTAFAEAHPASWPHVATSMVTFIANALAAEVHAVVTAAWQARPMIYTEGTSDFDLLLFSERPSPRPLDLERRGLVAASVTAFARAIGLPDGAGIEIDEGVHKFATSDRQARVRCTAVLAWVNAPGQASRLVVLPLESIDHLVADAGEPRRTPRLID